MQNIVSLKNVSKIYYSKSGNVCALNDICLDIPEGAFTAVIGQSGSGKSTLMNILGCLDTPTSGDYYLKGKNVSRLKERQLSYIRNRVIGFVFQSFNLIPDLTALENAELPLIYRGTDRRTRHQLAEKALCMVGLSERLNHKPNELSGGQQQRVAIARTIAANPEILLADEPTGSLDSRSSNEVMDILRELNKNGTAVILITHDQSIAKRADNCIKISDGKLVM